jgi:hypothetical protein
MIPRIAAYSRVCAILPRVHSRTDRPALSRPACHASPHERRRMRAPTGELTRMHEYAHPMCTLRLPSIVPVGSAPLVGAASRCLPLVLLRRTIRESRPRNCEVRIAECL